MSVERLAAVDTVIAQLRGLAPTFHTVPVLLAVISTALRVPPPRGDLAVIRSQNASYTAAKATVDDVMSTLKQVPHSIPDVWRGTAAQNGGQMLNALAAQIQTVGSGFDTGATVLDTWAEQLVKARAFDSDGRDQLRAAHTLLSRVPFGLSSEAMTTLLGTALEHTASGCHALRAGAQVEDDAGRDAATALRLSTLRARARQFAYTGAGGLDSIVLAYQGPNILSPATIGHASELLAAMSDQDRNAFDALVSGAASTAEVAYLWKALGAGYTMAKLIEFDQAIHPHAGDTVWLRQHLSPNVRSQQFEQQPAMNQRNELPYDSGQADSDAGLVPFYSQGDQPTCVAASDTVARLDMDPVLMLGVTTGTGPAAVLGAPVSADSVAAVHSRVQQLYAQNYQAGQAADSSTAHWGVGGRGADALNASLLSPVTGKAYDTTALDSVDARRAALPRIQAAAAAGNPVPFTVEGVSTDVDRLPSSNGVTHRPELTKETVAHQMLVVDARDDRLEIYDPYGYTQWVSTADFVNNRLGEVTGTDPRGGRPDVVSASIPLDEAAQHGATDR
ncbi:hypothetical protein [Nocardia tengchongensis]|uniref:hypothetical protein n=1 Tax=Nocardia tengchongensis TaxID=2055889 RepID=UPI0036B21474